MRLVTVAVVLFAAACRPAPAPGRATVHGEAKVPPGRSPEGMTVKIYRGTPAGRGMGLPIDLSYDREPDLTLLPNALGRELQSPASTLTLDPSGAFKFADLKPGSYHLEFKSPGLRLGSLKKEVWVVVPGLELGADQDIDLGGLVIVRPRQGP